MAMGCCKIPTLEMARWKQSVAYHFSRLRIHPSMRLARSRDNQMKLDEALFMKNPNNAGWASPTVRRR